MKKEYVFDKEIPEELKEMMIERIEQGEVEEITWMSKFSSLLFAMIVQFVVNMLACLLVLKILGLI